MTKWINYPLTLEGHTVELVSMDEHHFEPLKDLAKDKRIWEFYPYDGSDPSTFQQIFSTGLIEREKGNQYPFVIINRATKEIVGSTRFLDMQLSHRKLEIGSTWLHPCFWATEINLECKLVLLTYCFESLRAVRVQLKTDENNLRSRKAIEKIGGQFEGILRNDMIRDNKTNRNSAYYSIIDTEWPSKKIRLQELYNIKKHHNI